LQKVRGKHIRIAWVNKATKRINIKREKKSVLYYKIGITMGFIIYNKKPHISQHGHKNRKGLENGLLR